jgi:hypothetical protein
MKIHRSARHLAHMASALCIAAAALAAGTPAWAQRTPLLVYTALETDAMKLYKDAFEKTNPDIEVKWVRDSTGIVTAKLLAEKANPQADVVAGLAASSLALLQQEGMLQPYEPKGFKELNPAYSDAARPPAVGGHGRVGRHHLLQPRRGAEARPAQAGELEGPGQAGLQGHHHHAAPGLQRHRLSRRVVVAAEHGRRRRLEVHGRAAPERGPVRAFGLQAVQAGGRGRIPDRHLVRVPRAPGEEVGRAGRPDLPEGRPGLGHRGHQHHEDEQEDGAGQALRRLDGQQGGQPDHRHLVGRWWRTPAWRRSSRAFPTTTRSCSPRTT